MLLPWRTLPDPFYQQLDFLLRQRALRVRRRHARQLIFSRDPAHELAPFGMTGHDRAALSAEIGLRRRFGIEPQFDLLVWRIRAVTDPAFVGKDRTDVAVEINSALSRAGLGAHGHCRP